jgi:hypothetical protein
MTFIRPQGVSENATLIYPGQTFFPGLGVQLATIVKISAIIQTQNARAATHYANGLQDWLTNASIYANLMGMPVPPPPAKPQETRLNVVYATQDGTVVAAPPGADGLHGAWIEEVPA